MPVRAEHCTTWTTSTTSSEMIVVAPGVNFVLGDYLVNDLCQFDEEEPDPDPGDPYHDGGGPCLFSVWFYYETNGIPGLQRGDEEHDDTCHGMIESDTILF